MAVTEMQRPYGPHSPDPSDAPARAQGASPHPTDVTVKRSVYYVAKGKTAGEIEDGLNSHGAGITRDSNDQGLRALVRCPSRPRFPPFRQGLTPRGRVVIPPERTYIPTLANRSEVCSNSGPRGSRPRG